MSENVELLQIAMAREDIKNINEMARKIYMTALNAMLKARRTSCNNQGYTRVTAELRKFSVRMEESMRDLSLCATEIVKAVAMERTRKRIAVMMCRTVIESEKRKNMSNKRNISLVKNKAKILNDNNDNNDKYGVAGLYCRFATSVDRIRPLCKLGQNVAVLAKVEAMYVAEDVQMLHDIAEEMDQIITTVEQQLDIVSGRLAA